MKIVDALMTLGFTLVAGTLAPLPSVGQGTTSEYRYTTESAADSGRIRNAAAGSFY
jgi:hypothetical protein